MASYQITDKQIETLRQMAYSAGDMTQVLVCEVALGDREAVELLYEELPHLRGRVEALGLDAADTDAARAMCARALTEGRAAHGD